MNRISGTLLRDLLPELSAEVLVDSVLAAVAYGSSTSDFTQDLVEHCAAHKGEIGPVDALRPYGASLGGAVEAPSQISKGQRLHAIRPGSLSSQGYLVERLWRLMSARPTTRIMAG